MPEIDEDLLYPGEHELMDAFHNGQVTYSNMEPAEEAAFLDSVAQAAAQTPENVDDMLAGTSLRLTVGTLNRVKALAERKGVKPSALMRGWIEAQLSIAENDHPISLAEAMTALATLRPAA